MDAHYKQKPIGSQYSCTGTFSRNHSSLSRGTGTPCCRDDELFKFPNASSCAFFYLWERLCSETDREGSGLCENIWHRWNDAIWLEYQYSGGDAQNVLIPIIWVAPIRGEIIVWQLPWKAAEMLQGDFIDQEREECGHCTDDISQDICKVNPFPLYFLFLFGLMKESRGRGLCSLLPLATRGRPSRFECMCSW